tara:strand:- start:3662 stop:4333 length:672 start_codon:yes stop_codon:yes gene_type:complete
MPSKSKAQQRFMGMVHAYNKGEMPDAPASVKKVAKDMKKSDVKKYASTKHKGKPEKVRQESITELVPNMSVVNNKAYQAMLNRKIGDVKVATALSNKNHKKHKQAKSMIDRLKDKIKSKLSQQKNKPKPKSQSKSDADFYKKMFTGEQVDFVKEYIKNRIPQLVAEAKDNFDPVKVKKLMKKDRFLQMAYKTIKGKNEEEKLSRLYFNLIFKDKKYEPKYKKV